MPDVRLFVHFQEVAVRKVVVCLRSARSRPCREVSVTGDPDAAYAIANEVHSRIRTNLVPVRTRLGLQWNNRQPFWSPAIERGAGSVSFPVECPDRVPTDEFEGIVEKSIREAAAYNDASFLVPLASQGGA